MMLRRPSDETAKEVGQSSDYDETLLGILSVIDRDAYTTQRTVSRELGVALGLANAYLRRCVRKGLIKIGEVPKRRYAYYLTPQGFAEKARLTAEYLSSSLSFFRTAREQMSKLFAHCASNGLRRVALAGVSDLAEIGRLCAYDHAVELVGIVDPSQAGTTYHGLPVVSSLDDCSPVDAVIITGLIKPETTYETLARTILRERIFAPRVLRLKLSSTEARNGGAE
jgi:DNA-binding MarR family transcriptional regulator